MEDEALTTGSQYKWLILLLTWLVYFSFGLILTSIPPLVTPISAELSLSYSEMGVIIGSVILMYIPLSIPIGIIIDHIGQKKMIAAGALLTSMSAVLRAFAFSFETLFLTVFLFGFGGPTISVGLAKVIASFFEGRERGIASGIYMTGSIVGSGVSLAITNSVILPLVGTWRNVFVAYGIIGFLTMVVWILLVTVPERTNEASGIIQPLRETTRKLLGHRQVWIVCIVGSSSFLVFYGFTNWLPTLLELKGLSSADAGLLSSLPSWVGLLGSSAIPGLAVVGSRKPVVVIVLLLEGISMAVAGLASGPVLTLALIAYGVTSGASMPLLLVVLMDLQDVGADYTGVASGIFFSIGAFCGFLGPAVVGYLTDLTGSFFPAIFTLTLAVEAMIPLTLTLKEL
ncbi:MAG: MFS transporter [Candidatus Thorarchaeota archaeon SMTZ1-83]|nr:MAG: hypothetical protein AM324_00625 [Candidatus Thorarchaeota archaeon SMTZ1-83]